MVVLSVVFGSGALPPTSQRTNMAAHQRVVS
ncbi:hypothetical protein XF_0179 [Xylella fastidiosa 9a5c]|uniref:Uncharacterized protein n=1 Tax=Xylella fastidiosa (strain 9a5c) TaxID=160492 RepID=Q9PGW9_XYLFA|nr:hypothetical protein XF_0179 [Xylella fastidiosa 9a5c]